MSGYGAPVDRARVWPDFDDAWIVHEDADILVVDKPDGIASQSADPERPDDLVTRVRAHLARREGRPENAVYVGTHQRLDRDTSGLIVLTRRREANASLAAQFEGRAVQKRYLACVDRWPAGKENTTLRDALAQGEHGRMEVVSASRRGAQNAVTQVRVVERQQARALLELTLETGRTHQARVQLAHAGSPIAGDALYGGAPALRLLLHASTLSFEHPGKDGGRPRRVRYEVKAPAELASFLAHGDLGEGIYDDDALLVAALARAMRRRFGLGRNDCGPRATTAFRVVNERGDALPELAVDLYGDHFVAQLYGSDGVWSDVARRERVLDRLSALGASGVYLKVRPKQANVIVDSRREDLAPKLPVRGTPAPDELTILEEGVPYRVRLGDGLSTGIFLDQRANRRRVRELASSGSGSVLNLFAYTCAFTVAAAVGGASRTVSVDASMAALERGRKNMIAAGVEDLRTHTFVADDVFRWLARADKKKETFDLVLLDPPSYSTTKHRRFAASSDYAELAAAALATVRPGGRLLACSNHRGVSRHKFRRALFDAARAAKRDVAQLKDLPDAADFPPALGAESHLKSALLTLRD